MTDDAKQIFAEWETEANKHYAAIGLALAPGVR
jgi:hypothetical protein